MEETKIHIKILEYKEGSMHEDPPTFVAEATLNSDCKEPLLDKLHELIRFGAKRRTEDHSNCMTKDQPWCLNNVSILADCK